MILFISRHVNPLENYPFANLTQNKIQLKTNHTHLFLELEKDTSTNAYYSKFTLIWNYDFWDNFIYSFAF